MKIVEIVSQYGRDFEAVYKCEHCGHERIGYGYDDSDFHINVIPEAKCKKCGNKGKE